MKDKEKKGTEQEQPSFFKELGCFMKPYSGKYTASVIISVLSVASNMAVYGFAAIIAARLFAGERDLKNIIIPAVMVAVFKILNAVFLNLSTWISHKAAYFTLKDIRLALTEKMLRMPMGYFEKEGSGRLKTLLVDHVENMEKTLAHMLPELTANLLAPPVLIIWMFFIDWRLASVMLLWIVLGLSVTMGMMKNYETKFAGQLSVFKAMNQAVVEFVNGIEVIKNFGRTKESCKKYHDAVYSHAEYNVNWQKETQSYTALGMAIAPFSVFPILLLGLYLWSKGSVTASTLFTVVILSLAVFGPIMNASGYFDQLAQMGVNAAEIKAVLDYKELERGEDKSFHGSDIEFKNVSFSYNGDGKKALDGVSFKVPEGTTFALTGPSGSGKSTIAKLLAGYWDADEGEILIGGKPIGSYTQEELNRIIAYIDQDTFLFEGTIMDNIRLSCPDADDEAVIDAAKRSGCHEFIIKLPNGYNTSVGAAGGKLSGGERQRIAIARAMMKNAPVLIMDEATSSSDPENEASIQEALSAAAKGRTLIVVAHRLRTVMNAETIAVVNDGKITAAGTHSELLNSCPQYKENWQLMEGGAE